MPYQYAFFLISDCCLFDVFLILLVHFNSCSAESSPTASSPSSGDDWRSAFDAAANGSSSHSRYGSSGSSRRYNEPAENGDTNSRSSSASRRTPNRLPPGPPASGSGYRS